MAWSKHTPGPHTVEQIGKRPIMKAVNATVISKGGERLADFRHVADANLFAAAPELLDALRQAERFMAGFEGDELQGGIDERIATIRAAIAKAEAA